MNSFDSPMQSLPPFTYDHLFTIVFNNFWTCLAVLCAAGAVRFLITPNKSASSPSFSDNTISTPSDNNQKPDPVHSCCKENSEPAADGCAEGIITRGKFVEYYYDYEEEVDRESYDEGESEVEEVIDGGEWELFRVRESKMGWYRYQDLTVFTGNVVRLWDDHGLI